MITEIKKIAVEMLFWPACPVDDDYCFDAIKSERGDQVVRAT
ncbi:hypothetical protein [Erwinia tasmaniensis]|nr:hypothetical protein [Erwinia tasmaniensis]